MASGDHRTKNDNAYAAKKVHATSQANLQWIIAFFSQNAAEFCGSFALPLLKIPNQKQHLSCHRKKNTVNLYISKYTTSTIYPLCTYIANDGFSSRVWGEFRP